jgi:ligand-binding sensor domain-containing protein/signal transduction histidine kinase
MIFHLYIFSSKLFRSAFAATIASVALFYSSNVSSQNYYFKHYQVENGLSNNDVRAVFQDKAGFVWFGTRDGLNRFDGYSFKVFRSDPSNPGSIGNSFIRCLAADNNQKLLVGTRSGIYRYEELTETFELVKGTANLSIKEILNDSKGNMWFVGKNKFFKHNYKTGVTVALKVDSASHPNSFCITPSGGVWVCTTSGLLKRFDEKSNLFTGYNMFSHSPKALSNNIESSYALNDSAILIGTRNQGVKLFNTKTNTYTDLINYDKSGSKLLVRDFLEYGHNEVWIGTEAGIYIYNTVTKSLTLHKKNYTNPFSLSDDVVYDLYKDRENNVWIATYFGGVNYYSRQNNLFEKYFKGNEGKSINGNAIRDIEKDGFGNLWISSEDGGLNKIDAKEHRIYSYTTSTNNLRISSNNIHALLVNGNELWIGTFNDGIEVLNIKTGKIIHHFNQGEDSLSLKSNLVNSLVKTKAGEILVGSNTGLYRYNASKKNFTAIPQLTGYIICTYEDYTGTIWTGTQLSGIEYYNPRTGEAGTFAYDANNNKSISDNSINGFFEDSNKNLWVATDGGGLCRLNRKDKTFKRVTTRDGLPSNFVFAVLEDEQKQLWITTSQGLVRYNVSRGSMNTYTTADGLLTNQFNYNSSFRDDNGEMYFGSVKGLISFHPGDFTLSNFSPPVVITGLLINNKEVEINKDNSALHIAIPFTPQITLEHNQSTISIDFAALSFIAPEKTRYAYKLDGLDKDYTNLNSNRRVYYTNLSPGLYLFRVKTLDTQSPTNKETVLRIRILPPIWASGLAFLVYIVLSIALLYLIIRNYHRRLEEKKEKEIYEAKIEFFTNVSHEIKSPLTLIKGPLENLIENAEELPDMKEDLLMMEKSTDRLINLTNQLLDFRGVESKGFRLSFDEHNITEIVEDCYENYESAARKQHKQFNICLPSEPLLAFVDAEAFRKIVTNLLSNALKYSNTWVDINVIPKSEDGLCFIIEVESDGSVIPEDMKEKIFEPFYRLKVTENKQGTGIGLALARSLAELHKGELYVKKGAGSSNVFVLSLPIKSVASEGKKKKIKLNKN